MRVTVSTSMTDEVLGGQTMNINDMWREFEQTGSVKAYLLYKNKEKLMYEMAKEPLEENTEVEE